MVVVVEVGLDHGGNKLVWWCYEMRLMRLRDESAWW